MLQKAFYKTISGMFRWKKYQDGIVIPVWELIVIFVLTGVILYLLTCTYYICLEWVDDEYYMQ